MPFTHYAFSDDSGHQDGRFNSLAMVSVKRSDHDDSANLVRMYYHLTSYTLSKRWPISESCWKWFPDEQSSVCWDTLRDCLKTKKHSCTADLFDENPAFEQVNLREIEPSESNDFPMIQVADLFAGMGAYSFGHYDKFKIWKSKNNNQLSIFELPKEDFSNSENERFTMIDKVNKMAKENKLSIGLDKTKGFRSFKPNCFINFLPYIPQHELDKAPRK